MPVTLKPDTTVLYCALPWVLINRIGVLPLALALSTWVSRLVLPREGPLAVVSVSAKVAAELAGVKPTLTDAEYSLSAFFVKGRKTVAAGRIAAPPLK